VTKNKPTKLVKIMLKWMGAAKFSDEQMTEIESYISDAIDQPANSGKGLLGATCTLNIVHVTTTKGFDMAVVGSSGEDISPALPGKENLKLSADYTPYWERVANAERMKAERAAKSKDSGQSQQQTKDKPPF
jgi:hypothetical protein